MSSQSSFTDLLFFSLKGFLATIVVLGILLGYQERIFGLSFTLVGSCIVGESVHKIIQQKEQDNN